MSADATVVFAALKRLCKFYTLDFAEAIKVCNLSDAHAHVDVDSNANEKIKIKMPTELELITIHRKKYLYDAANRHVYSNDARPRYVGFLCPNTKCVIVTKGKALKA